MSAGFHLSAKIPVINLRKNQKPEPGGRRTCFRVGMSAHRMSHHGRDGSATLPLEFLPQYIREAPGLALQTWHSQMRRIEPGVTPLYMNVNRVESRLYSRGPSGIFGETRKG